jgi:hypothetical protein
VGAVGSQVRTLTLTAIGYIRLLYEAHYSSMTDDVVNMHVRSASAVPLLASMRTWLDEMLLKAKPDTLMHKALGYLDRQWLVLQRFLQDGNIGLDTNPAERALRRGPQKLVVPRATPAPSGTPPR